MPKEKRIGLLAPLTPDLFRSEYFMRILSGIFKAAAASPYSLEWILIKNDKELLSPDFSRAGALSGLLVLSWRLQPAALEAWQKKTALPAVCINDFAPKMHASVIYCQSKIGIYLAMKHLLKQGRKRIGMLRAPGENSLDAQERYRIYRQVLKHEGLGWEESWVRVCRDYFPQDGYAQTADILKNCRVLPDALLCFNDDLAFGALRALKDAAVECPGRMAVMGYDDMEKSRYAVPALTTVRQPLEAMGAEMFQLAVDLHEGKAKGPVRREFAQELVVRQSA